MKNLPTFDFRFVFSLLLIVLLAPLSGCKDDPERIKSLHCIPQDLQANVIALYSFPEGSLNDFTGNKKKLTKVGAVQMTEDRFGNPNCAYALDNIPAENNMYLTLDDPSYLNGVKEFTISLWYAPSDPTRDGGIFESLIHRGADFSCDGWGSWSIGLYDCRKVVYAASSTLWDESLTLNCESEVTLRTGKWHHVVATYKAETMRMELFSNGIYQGFAEGSDACRNPLEDVGALFLGYGYTGSIDDVIIFNKVLSEDEVDAINAAGACL